MKISNTLLFIATATIISSSSSPLEYKPDSNKGTTPGASAFSHISTPDDSSRTAEKEKMMAFGSWTEKNSQKDKSKNTALKDELPKGNTSYAIPNEVYDAYVKYKSQDGDYIPLGAASLSGKEIRVTPHKTHRDNYYFNRNPDANTLESKIEYNGGSQDFSDQLSIIMTEHVSPELKKVDNLELRKILTFVYRDFAAAVIGRSYDTNDGHIQKIAIRNFKSWSKPNSTPMDTFALRNLLNRIGSPEETREFREKHGIKGLIEAINVFYFTLADIDGEPLNSSLIKDIFFEREIATSVVDSVEFGVKNRPIYLMSQDLQVKYYSAFGRKMSNFNGALISLSKEYKESTKYPRKDLGLNNITEKDSLYLNSVLAAAKSIPPELVKHEEQESFIKPDSFLMSHIGDRTIPQDSENEGKALMMLYHGFFYFKKSEDLVTSINTSTESVFNFIPACSREITDRNVVDKGDETNLSASIVPGIFFGVEKKNSVSNRTEREVKTSLNDNCLPSSLDTDINNNQDAGDTTNKQSKQQLENEKIKEILGHYDSIDIGSITDDSSVSLSILYKKLGVDFRNWYSTIYDQEVKNKVADKTPNPFHVSEPLL